MVEYENALKNKPIPETIRKLVEQNWLMTKDYCLYLET